MSVVWYSVYDAKPRNFVTISFLDVDEGDATLIQGRNGNQILIDGGPNREVLTSLSNAMPYFDRTLSAIIEQTDDKDNASGIPFITEEYPPAQLFTLGSSVQSTAHTEILRLADVNHISKEELSDGMKIDLHDGSYIQVFDIGGVFALQYVYGNTCVFIAGNLVGKAETQFLKEHSDISCPVLKVAHHGAKSGTGEMFLSQINPTYVILSNVKENRYEYPDQEVVDRLHNHEVTQLQTFEKGTISIQMDGNTVQMK